MTVPTFSSGQAIRITEDNVSSNYAFVERTAVGKIVLADMSDGKERRFQAQTFEKLWIDGKVTLPAQGTRSARLDRLLMMPKDDPRRPREEAVLIEAETLHFYCGMFDVEGCSNTNASRQEVIIKYLPRAIELGLRWKGKGTTVSVSALQRALELGSPGNRSLAAIFEDRHKHTMPKTHPFYFLREEMFEKFWSARAIKPLEPITKFREAAKAINEKRVEDGKKAFTIPSKTTLRRWIADSETYDRYKTKFSQREADRRYRGVGEGLQATKPLQMVLLDHTECDTELVVRSEAGEVIATFRPFFCIAVDLYSRMVLASFLTFEPPSLLSVMECIRRAILPNDELVERYGVHKGATDGHGLMVHIVLDNALENIGKSMKGMCHSIGIEILHAPVRTPEFKGVVERILRTINDNLWHRLPGGIPHKPSQMSALGLDPRKEAAIGLEEANDLLTDYFVTIYHLEEHGSIGMAPALKWRDGLLEHGRDVPEDPSLLGDVFGQIGTGTLTREGIYVDGFLFHDPKLTTSLLVDLLPTAKKRFQRKTPLQTGKVAVQYVKHPENCSYVSIFNPKRGEFVRLPNAEPQYSEGLSWKAAKEIKRFAKERSLAFHSEDEKQVARERFFARLEAAVQKKPRREAKLANRLLHLERGAYGVGSVIEEHLVEPTPLGMASVDKPRVAPIKQTKELIFTAKGQRAGGKKATKKAVETRRKNASREIVADDTEHTPSIAPPGNSDFSSFVIPNPDDYFKRALERRNALK